MAADADAELRSLVHALRPPLTIVEGFADLLARRGDELSPEERAAHARRIAGAAGEMRALLDAAGSDR